MAESPRTVEHRLVATILTELSQRVDTGFRQVWEELRHGRDETRGLREEMGGVNERLDRLIAVTLQERTGGIERLAAIEERLAKLEERVGT